MRTNRATGRSAIVLLIMLITVLALYYHMANRVKKNAPEVQATVVQSVILKDLENSYPATPREVMKYYNDIMHCFYNEEYTDGELDQLAEKAVSLYDDELISIQGTGYLDRLKLEIKGYREKDKKLSSAALASSTDVDYFTYEDRECAKIRCVYTMREKTNLYAVKEIYVLRKDEDGHWKILGWDIYNNNGE